MLKAILYTRVSTGEQAENGTSLAGQLNACRAKAEAIGAVIVNVYEDAGVSGALYQSRKGMQAALRDLETGLANTLIIANLSRFSRDSEHQNAIKKRVRAAGAQLVFCDMEFADTPEGDLAFGIMGTFADHERKVIKERTMKGRRRRAEQGIQPCRNHSPFGYHVVTNKDVLSGAYPPDALGIYQVIEEQATLVREMFARVAAGESIRSVARWLTNAGIPTPRGAIVWNWGSLQRLLQHPVYKGVAPFGRFERPELAASAIRAYKKTQASRHEQPDIGQLQQQLEELHRQEQATIKAQIAGVMAGADSSIYEAALRALAAKRNHIKAVLAQAGHQPAGKMNGKDDAATIITRAIAAVVAALTAPDAELTPGEKQGLLSRVIDGIYPENSEGLKIVLKPSLTINQSVSYFTT